MRISSYLQMLKAAGFILIFGCATVLLLLGGLLYTDATFASASARIPLALFLFAIAILLIDFGRRLIKSPLPKRSTPLIVSWLNDLQSRFPSGASKTELATIENLLFETDLKSALGMSAQLLKKHPRDCVLLWLQADLLLTLDEGASGESICDRLLTELVANDPSLYYEPGIYFVAAGKRLHAIMLQNDGRFEGECAAFLEKVLSPEAKIILLDQLACIPLFQEKPELYHLADFCIRRALEIEPGAITLQGTLGALLAEQGCFAEAEPLLRECYERSSGTSDRGIASYYLALLAERSGDYSGASKLAKQAATLYPERWLVRKANALFDQIDSCRRVEA